MDIVRFKTQVCLFVIDYFSFNFFPSEFKKKKSLFILYNLMSLASNYSMVRIGNKKPLFRNSSNME